MQKDKQPKRALTCKHCGHVWVSRIDTRPMKCPNAKCQAFDWDKRPASPKVIKGKR